jgi:hypothetical protein
MTLPSAPSLGERLGPRTLRLALIALWAYASVVLLFQERIAGVAVGFAVLAVVFATGCVLIAALTRARFVRRLVPPSRMLDVGLLLLLVVIALPAFDLVLAMRHNRARAAAQAAVASDVRQRDGHLWHGELFPRLYFPPGEGIMLYKPDVRLSGETFGEAYSTAMLASRTMADSVLERRRLSYFIGPHGLRELEALAASRIFALGDSFVFGYATDEGKTWPDVLGAALGEPVFNLGVSSTGPRAHLELLKFMLKTYGDSMHVRHLLWMIFEGNDLENSYGPLEPDAAPGPSLFDGTVVEALLSLPARLKQQSVLQRWRRGELALATRSEPFGQFRIDGVALTTPLFHSPRWGYRIFYRADIDAAISSREYLLSHPNRPLLDQTFREMQALSRQSGFKVTVILAPSDARLYGPAFDGFPAVSGPHFIDYVAKLAGDLGFTVVNLLPLLEPFAQKELLYYRDDHHWNVRGNSVVAGLIRAAIAEH